MSPTPSATADFLAPDRPVPARAGAASGPVGLKLGLGLDAGGTQTRWALARPDGTLVARGEVGGFSALLLDTSAGRVVLAQTLQSLAAAVLSHAVPGALSGLQAGITGLGEPEGPAGRQLRALLAQQLGLAPAQIQCDSDIAQAWHALFRPGEGYLVYAGTGAIAAFIDEAGTLHRAGGRGPLLGDEGGGQWIAREALALVWRREDESPGAWTGSRSRDISSTSSATPTGRRRARSCTAATARHAEVRSAGWRWPSRAPPRTTTPMRWPCCIAPVASWPGCRWRWCAGWARGR
ncbi:BadF/BadG/BcrA/BcrD ATPase family protein [Roseateles chitinivorans]|uniref:BadF/BadG/BcrA/BcrD ATPase family protein n=1 Tax=Roseateles chitinivorans TaxID=2917965 RepID=UPI003D67A3CD